MTVKPEVGSVEGSATTWLTGDVLSIVLIHVCVVIGALVSKTMVAWFEICVPVLMIRRGVAVYITLPSAPGGKTPRLGSLGGRPVVGSTEANCTVRMREAGLRETLTFISKCWAGRKSIAVLA